MAKIVVGVDGSAGSLAALRWALGEGRVRGATVDVVHAWHPPYVGGEMMATGTYAIDAADLLVVGSRGRGGFAGMLVIADTKSQLGYGDMSFAVPWLNLALIFGAVIVASLLTTLVSALRATRIYPAEALRYQ